MSVKTSGIKVFLCRNSGNLPPFVRFAVINQPFLNSSSLNISFDVFSHLGQNEAFRAPFEATAGSGTFNVF